MHNETLIIEQGSGNLFADLDFPPKKLGITQPRLNLLLKGKINEFSIDALVNMAAKAGMRVEIKVMRAA